MSPLLEFQTARLSGPAFEMMARQNPELVLAESAVLDREFLEMAVSDPVDRLIGGLPESLDVLLLQAEKDEITPASAMNAKLPLFVKRPQVEMIATDHSFVIGREVISARIARFLS
jgi:hypothetical protein